MKKILILVCAAMVCFAAQAENPVLKFGKNGTLKIAQFTDVHFDLGTEYRRAEAEKVLEQMHYVLDAERPDFVIFTGDIVTGKPAAEGWRRVLEPVAERNIPFCVVLGNHDAEQDLTRAQIAALITAHTQSLNKLDEKKELADLVLEVKSAKGPAALFYCMDSHDYSTIEQIDGYGWFTHEQVGWFRQKSAQYTKANGGKPLPALAFFHIALPEYVAAWRNEDNTHIGRGAEDECPGELNTGMFAAMRESRDVMGIFVGHDHDNDYVVAEKGIALGYGRFSGYDTTYNNLRHGIRLVVLEEGKRGFETWIRERDGRIVDHVKFSEGKIQKIKK